MSLDACVVTGDRARACADAIAARLRASSDGADDGAWIVETKYYRARVRCVVVASKSDSRAHDVDAGETGDARCVIAACSSVEAWAEARDALARDGALGWTRAGADARALAWDDGRAADAADVPEEVRAWALDEGYEVIVARFDDAVADEALREGEDGDARGTARCVAALEACAWAGATLTDLGRESDLGREMAIGGRDAAADVRSLAVASGLLGDDANASPPPKELRAKIAALYDEQLALKGEERLERLAELLGDAILDDDDEV